MTPSNFIFWALGIGLSWAIFVTFVPIDRWVGNFLARRQARLRELEERVAAVERRLGKSAGSSADRPA